MVSRSPGQSLAWIAIFLAVFAPFVFGILDYYERHNALATAHTIATFAARAATTELDLSTIQSPDVRLDPRRAPARMCEVLMMNLGVARASSGTCARRWMDTFAVTDPIAARYWTAAERQQILRSVRYCLDADCNKNDTRLAGCPRFDDGTPQACVEITVPVRGFGILPVRESVAVVGVAVFR